MTLKLLLGLFAAPPPTPAGPRHTITATLATWFASVVGVVPGQSIGRFDSPTYSLPSGTSGTVNVFILSDNAIEDIRSSQDNAVRLGMQAGVRESDFPSSITIKRGATSLVCPKISGSYTTRGLGEQVDYAPPSDPLSADTFASGDTVTVELYD